MSKKATPKPKAGVAKPKATKIKIVVQTPPQAQETPAKAPSIKDDGCPAGEKTKIVEQAVRARYAGKSWDEVFLAAKDAGFTAHVDALKTLVAEACGGKLPGPTGGKSEPKQPKEKAPKPDGGKMSGLDAAAKVLAEAGAPMNAKDMFDTAAAKGYWSSNGKTPASTIYAAIIREIAKKGLQARFKKTERGLFTVA